MKQSGTMRVGYLEWEPCVYRPDGAGEFIGIFVDMTKEIAQTLNLKIEWVKTDLASFTKDLVDGKMDFCVGPTFMTLPRATRVQFTQAVAYIGNSGVVRRGSVLAPRTWDALAQPGIKIAVLRGQAMDTYAKRAFPKADLLVLPGDDLEAPLDAASNGRADIGLSNTVTVLRYLEKDSNVEAVFVGTDEQMDILPICWSTAPGDDALLRFLDSTISYFKSTGRLKTLQANYPIKLLYDTPPLHAE
ncbi:MAG: transporter substrate-binding domain-containing protein [Deltaproteobacteria bacterium]|nr:transporter substrate-binding domain-containing protein [Deltaproteobacteria bacterium]